jgi:hypothetical protein
MIKNFAQTVYKLEQKWARSIKIGNYFFIFEREEGSGEEEWGERRGRGGLSGFHEKKGPDLSFELRPRARTQVQNSDQARDAKRRERGLFRYFIIYYKKI